MKKHLIRIVTAVISIAVVGGLLLAGGTTEVASAKDPPEKVYKWRLAQHNPRGTLYYAECELTGKLIEKMTGGRFKITQFAGGELIKAAEIFDAVGKGIIEMGFTDMGYYKGIMPVMSIDTGLPMGTRSARDNEILYFSPEFNLMKILREACAKHNVYYLGPMWGGPYRIISRSPIDSLDTLKKMKIRTIGTVADMLKRAGTSIVYVPGPEIYSSVATGVFDGFTWGGAAGAYGLKGYEVAKYLLHTPLMNMYTNAVLVNLDVWKALSDSDKAIFESAARRACLEHYRATSEYELKAVEDMVKLHGVTVTYLPDKDVATLTAIAMAVWDELAKVDALSAEAVRLYKKVMKFAGYTK